MPYNGLPVCEQADKLTCEMKQIRILRFFIYFAVLLIGVIIGIAVRHYNNISLAAELNLVDIATLVVTVFLAVYIPEMLDRKLQSDKDKQRLIEIRITEFQTLMKRANTLVQDNLVTNLNGYLTLKNTMDVAHNKLETIVSLIKYANMHDDTGKETRKLLSLVKEHNGLLFIDSEAISDFTYTNEIRTEEERLYNEIDKVSSLLVFHIGSN